MVLNTSKQVKDKAARRLEREDKSKNKTSERNDRMGERTGNHNGERERRSIVTRSPRVSPRLPKGKKII